MSYLHVAIVKKSITALSLLVGTTVNRIVVSKIDETRCNQTLTSLSYFMPQAPTSALTSSRKDVKQLVYFQILQNADNIFFTQ